VRGERDARLPAGCFPQAKYAISGKVEIEGETAMARKKEQDRYRDARIALARLISGVQAAVRSQCTLVIRGDNMAPLCPNRK
jgi:hypothetical protein